MKKRSLQKRLRRLWRARTGRDRAALLSLGAIASAYLTGALSKTNGASYLLCFVAFVPWIASLSRAARRRDVILSGLALSTAFVAFVFPWFPDTVASYAGGSSLLVWPLFLLLAPLLEPQFVVYALVRREILAAGGSFVATRAAIAASAAYVFVELVFPKLFGDTLALGLHPSPLLRQGADLAGAHGLTFVLLLVNECIAHALARLAPPREERSQWRALAPAALAAGLVLALVAHGRARLRSFERTSDARSLTVAIVQANITHYDKLRAEKGAFEAVRAILDAHFERSLRPREPLDLVVWPETVYPTTFGAPRSEDGAAFDAEIESFVQKNKTPLVFGAYEADGSDEYNAAFFLTPEPGGGVSRASYRKRMLFPLTEWVPEALDGPFLREAMPWAGRWKRGAGGDVVTLGSSGTNIVPLICYDVLYPELVAAGADKGADLVVTLSNDSWFPDGRAPRLHLVSAAFRSIETRLPQVRATNSGISAVISETGEILARTRFDEDDMLVTRVPLAGRIRTPMTAWAALRAPLLFGLATLLLASCLARNVRKNA